MLAGLFYMGLFVGIYKLGQFNERYPGRLFELVKSAWEKWTNQ